MHVYKKIQDPLNSESCIVWYFRPGAPHFWQRGVELAALPTPIAGYTTAPTISADMKVNDLNWDQYCFERFETVWKLFENIQGNISYIFNYLKIFAHFFTFFVLCQLYYLAFLITFFKAYYLKDYSPAV